MGADTADEMILDSRLRHIINHIRRSSKIF